jgi:hypothetical protein
MSVAKKQTVGELVQEFLDTKENPLTLPQVLERMPWFPQVPIRPKPASEPDLGPEDGSRLLQLTNDQLSQALLRLSGDQIFWVPPREHAPQPDEQLRLGDLEQFLYNPSTPPTTLSSRAGGNLTSRPLWIRPRHGSIRICGLSCLYRILISSSNGIYRATGKMAPIKCRQIWTRASTSANGVYV